MKPIVDVQDLSVHIDLDEGRLDPVRGVSFSIASYPWRLIPLVAVVITVLAFNFLGDGLRDAADPYK